MKTKTLYPLLFLFIGISCELSSFLGKLVVCTGTGGVGRMATFIVQMEICPRSGQKDHSVHR